MDMKRLEISRLMDEYVDGEFFPEGGSSTDVEAVKARVLANAAPAGKRRMPPLKAALLAAALALVGVLCIAAGLPGLVYQLANGTLTFTQTSNSKIATVFSDVIMNLEDNRVFSLLNGEHVDITDRISQDTPYITDCSDPETGLTHYIIMGGTPEHYGWFEWIVTPDPFTYEEGSAMHEGAGEGIFSTYVYHSYRWKLSEDGTWEADRTGDLVGSGRFTWSDGTDLPPWLFAAIEELDIPREYIPPQDITTIHER